MISKKKVLAVIPARGGSKGIKNKNIIDFCGKPLIHYTIDAARKSRYIDEVIVSTDSEQIRDISLSEGAKVPFLRPAELASDTAKTAEAVWHAIRELEKAGESYDILVLLQPTSPLRTVKDIDGALEKFEDTGQKGLLSISEAKESPLLIRRVTGNKMERLTDMPSTVRRQDMPRFYKVNGSIYINRICDIGPDFSFNDNPEYYIMDKSHGVDIDELADLELAGYYMNRRNR